MRRASFIAVLSLATYASAEPVNLENGVVAAQAAVANGRKTLVAAAKPEQELADRSFLKESKVPPALRRMIVANVEARCPKAQALTEIETDESPKVKSEHLSGSKTYVTTFSTSWYFDGMHPVRETITVRSEEMADASPENRFRVDSVNGEGELCPKDGQIGQN